MDVEDGTLKMVPIIVPLYDAVYSTPHFVVTARMSPVKVEFVRVFIVTVTYECMTIPVELF